jgi:peptidoglycan hydrolase-like protein with peptidoglycan-binding domain
VRRVQQAINRLARAPVPGLWVIPEDGVFGAETRDAIFAFQRKFGLAIDGEDGIKRNVLGFINRRAYSAPVEPPRHIFELRVFGAGVAVADLGGEFYWD